MYRRLVRYRWGHNPSLGDSRVGKIGYRGESAGLEADRGSLFVVANQSVSTA